jgi:hypothetical protein
VTAAGTYSVVVTEGGCSGRDTVVIRNCNQIVTGCAPIAYFRVVNVSPTNTVTLKDSSINGRTSYWIFGDGTTDTTSGNQVHTYTYNGSGKDTIKLIVCNDTCGCDTFVKVVTLNPTGISDISGLNDVNLYPNPASNSCTIGINATENLDLNIDVNNILGATVQTGKWQINSGENKLTLDLSSLSPGMYTVTLRSASGVITRKLDIIK